MPGSTVFLLNTVTGKAKVLKTDANGQFKSPVEKGVFYVVKSMDNKYLADCLSFEIAADDTATRANTPRDLLLDLLEMNKVFKLNNMNLDIENIYYDFNKWYIRPDAEVELDKLVQIMKENPVNIELGSHTDSRGTAEYNKELSQKRAESVVRYIVLQGIASTRLTAKGYGESKLTNRCSDGVACSSAEHQANRRTEFKVTGFSTPCDNTRYDMNKFKTGDEIPVYMFDRDFFINCLQDKLESEPAGMPAENVQSTEPVKEQAKTIQPAEQEKVVSKTVVNAEPAKTQVKTTKPAEIAKAPVTEPKPATTVKKDANAIKEIPAEKRAEKINTPTSITTSFRVQVYALSRFLPLNAAEFANLEDIQRYEEDGLYKYTAGNFTTTEEAHAYRDMMVDMGFEDAFVVTFENGKRVNMPQASK